MVMPSFRCEVCHGEQSTYEQAEACEKKGEYPVMPVGSVYASLAAKMGPHILVLGEKAGVEKNSHSNLYYAASILNKDVCCGLIEIVVPEDGTRLGNGSKLVQNPREELREHPCYEHMITILETLEQGKDIGKGVRKVEEKLLEERIASVKKIPLVKHLR